MKERMIDYTNVIRSFDSNSKIWACELRVSSQQIASCKRNNLQVESVIVGNMWVASQTIYELRAVSQLACELLSHVRLSVHFLHNIPSFKWDKVKVMFNNNSWHAPESNGNLLFLLCKMKMN